MLKGVFTGEEFDDRGDPAAQLRPSSINHLPVTRRITKAVAIPHSCILSGPNGNIRFWCFEETRARFGAEFFTSFSPISVLEIRHLWVGQHSTSRSGIRHTFPEQTVVDIRNTFRVLAKVEDLTLVSCKTAAFFSTLGVAADDEVLLPGLRRLTIFVGCEYLDVSAFIQCLKARKEQSRSLCEVTVVFEKEPEADLVEAMESLGEFVEELVYRVGEAPKLFWLDEDCDDW